MTDRDRPRWAVLVNSLAAAYRVELSEAQIDAYWFATEDLDLAALSGAIKRAIRTGGDFMPSPSKLRTLAGGPSAPYHRPWNPPETWRLPGRTDWPAMLEDMKPEKKS